MRCYNCGKELSGENSTKEHIPAKTLFEGYDDKFKKNRITVPSCFECNNKYSPTDEEFRNMIGIIAKHNENNTITEKSVKSIFRKDPNHTRMYFNPYGIVTGIRFSQQPLEEFHKKNFKGLFFHQYGYPLPNDYVLLVNIDENDDTEFTSYIISYLKDLFEWKYSGHKDIFSYCLQPFRHGITNTDKKDLELNKDENIIVGLLVYNREHAALVYAIRKEYLAEIERDRMGKR